MTYGETRESVVNQGVVEARYVAGYFREHMLMDAAEMDRARRGMVSVAKSRGLDIDAIFIEHLETAPEAFAAMIEKLQASGPKVLIIPGAHHLAGLGNHPLVVLQALKCGGVEVIFAPHVE
jgi:hypothetical protein